MGFEDYEKFLNFEGMEMDKSKLKLFITWKDNIFFYLNADIDILDFGVELLCWYTELTAVAWDVSAISISVSSFFFFIFLLRQKFEKKRGYSVPNVYKS